MGRLAVRNASCGLLSLWGLLLGGLWLLRACGRIWGLLRGALLRGLLLLLLLLFLLALLVSRSAHSGRDTRFLTRGQPVGILLNAFALGLTVDVEGSPVAALRGSVDRVGSCFRLRVGGIGLETVRIGEPA